MCSDHISVPTVEKVSDFFVCKTFVFHIDMGINNGLLSLLTDDLKLEGLENSSQWTKRGHTSTGQFGGQFRSRFM